MIQSICGKTDFITLLLLRRFGRNRSFHFARFFFLLRGHLYRVFGILSIQETENPLLSNRYQNQFILLSLASLVAFRLTP